MLQVLRCNMYKFVTDWIIEKKMEKNELQDLAYKLENVKMVPKSHSVQQGKHPWATSV